jgi:hypothetical protein
LWIMRMQRVVRDAVYRAGGSVSGQQVPSGLAP